MVNEPLREVQRMVDKVKYDKEVSISYMKSYERDWMMRNEGLATGRLEGEYIRLIKTLKDFLSDLGTIPEKIMIRIDNETDFTILERRMKLAAKSDSIEAFIERCSMILMMGLILN